jgi:hypothetical protein
MSGKRVLLISDTHGFHDNLKTVLEREPRFDRALHMGDTEGGDREIEEILKMPVDFVSGNCDWSSMLPSEKTVMVGGIPVFMTHGHEYYVTTGMSVLLHRAFACGAKIALFGHTHYPFLLEERGVLVANPGSISRPRQPGYVPSYGVLTIDGQGMFDIEIKYLED